jgi:hypothetical protein
MEETSINTFTERAYRHCFKALNLKNERFTNVEEQ